MRESERVAVGECLTPVIWKVNNPGALAIPNQQAESTRLRSRFSRNR